MILLEPVQTMGYLAYGSRATVTNLLLSRRNLYDVVEVPGAIRRLNLDTRLPDDDDGIAPTTVVLVASAIAKEHVLGALDTVSAVRPTRLYTTGALEAYSTALSRRDAIDLSALPEIVSITRETYASSPSDERSSRIVGGTFRTFGSAWPTSLPPNTQTPHYWDSFLSQLAGAFPGFNLDSHVIGVLDTGVDSGRTRNGSDYCPPFLRPPGYPSAPCKLVFTTVLTTALPEAYADDRLAGHGTIVASVAAGYAGSSSPGRDSAGFAFTQGVAQGARVAICKFWAACGTVFRAEGNNAPFNNLDPAPKLQYSLVALGSTNTIPDYGTGPGSTIFNHSWNRDLIGYDATAVLLDQTTRTLSVAQFMFRGNQLLSGADAPALHVVSAGNTNVDPPAPSVTAPATAKNVLTVGTTETLNPETHTPGCTQNDPQFADSPLQVAPFSRMGWSNLRLKPDLVAPGTRAYGARSVELACSGACNNDLTGSSQYAWSFGTSFAAPVVTGAATLVKEWLRATRGVSPSPALVKAALVATSKSLTQLQPCGLGCYPCCSYCGDVRPAPDARQGWGGVSLDSLFQPMTNYHIVDQSTQFTTANQTVTYTLNVVQNTRDVQIALVWTDRASAEIGNEFNNLSNDLDLSAFVPAAGRQYYGNLYYTAPGDCTRTPYSVANPIPVTRDRKNNVERITIKASELSPLTGQIFVTVAANAITANGLNPFVTSPFVQDYALFVQNAR